jgi:ribosomal protein S3
MGQKVNPIGLRLGINRNWESRWFPAKGRTADFIAEDYKIRKYLKKELFYAGVSNIIIERTVKKLRVNIVTARPGIIIGKKGADIEKLKATLIKMLGKDVAINIKEEKRPQASGQLAAENVATQLERRTAFRRAMKKVITHLELRSITVLLKHTLLMESLVLKFGSSKVKFLLKVSKRSQKKRKKKVVDHLEKEVNNHANA